MTVKKAIEDVKLGDGLEVLLKDDGVVFISLKGTNQWVELTKEQAVSLAKTIITKLME